MTLLKSVRTILYRREDPSSARSSSLLPGLFNIHLMALPSRVPMPTRVVVCCGSDSAIETLTYGSGTVLPVGSSCQSPRVWCYAVSDQSVQYLSPHAPLIVLNIQVSEEIFGFPPSSVAFISTRRFKHSSFLRPSSACVSSRQGLSS